MRRGSLAAGIGAVAFAVLPVIGMFLANPPGGSYSVHDSVKYAAKGHHTAVFVSVYFVLAGAIGLVVLLSRLRESIGGRFASVFWGLGVGGAAVYVAGYALVAALPVALTYGGANSGLTTTPSLTYILSESGWAIMFGAGCTLIGAALVTFAFASPTVPAWVRWTALVAGICGIASVAWFPYFVMALWALVIGVWLIAADRGTVGATAPQPA
jgi:hypothetical protein